MTTTFMACERYVQGPGAISQLGHLAKVFGRSPLVVLDEGIVGLLQGSVVASLKAAELPISMLTFQGEVTRAALEALAARAQPLNADLVIGIGGGKTLDAAKGLALRLTVDVISVPTIASTDAPASRGLVLYDEQHHIVGVEQLPRNPRCVVVDTALIANAPVRFIRAGIGDALAKKFEVDACRAAGVTNKHGSLASGTAIAIANACYETLRQHGADAVEAVIAHKPNEALERVVEACVLMSAMAFENGGLSLAHAMTTGLTHARGIGDRLHGEHVAYALLLQLALELRADKYIIDVIDFCRSVGLATRLDELGLTRPLEAELREIARLNVSSPLSRNFVVDIDEAAVFDAIQRIERIQESSAG